jgi:hypothetical protein
MLLFSGLKMSFTIKKSFRLVIGGLFVLLDVLQVTVSGCVFELSGAMVVGITISLLAKYVVALLFSPIFHSRLMGSSFFWQPLL